MNKENRSSFLATEYVFHLTVQKGNAILKLLKNGKKISEKSWPESRDTGRNLFEAIEALLKESRLRPEDIADFRLAGKASETSTSMRIAQTVARVYTFAVSANNHHHPKSGEQSEK